MITVDDIKDSLEKRPYQWLVTEELGLVDMYLLDKFITKTVHGSVEVNCIFSADNMNFTHEMGYVVTDEGPTNITTTRRTRSKIYSDLPTSKYFMLFMFIFRNPNKCTKPYG